MTGLMHVYVSDVRRTLRLFWCEHGDDLLVVKNFAKVGIAPPQPSFKALSQWLSAFRLFVVSTPEIRPATK